MRRYAIRDGRGSVVLSRSGADNRLFSDAVFWIEGTVATVA